MHSQIQVHCTRMSIMSNTFRSQPRHRGRFCINHFKLIKIQLSILSMYPYYNPIIKVLSKFCKTGKHND